MKKLILSGLAIFVATALQANPHTNTEISMIAGTHTYKGNDFKDTNVGVDLRKYILEGTNSFGQNVSIGVGAAISLAKNKTYFGNGNSGTVVITDLFAAGKAQLSKNFSINAMAGGSAGRIDGSAISSMVVGLGAKYSISKKNNLTAGIDFKENVNIGSNHIPEMDGENLYRYGVSLGYSF